jgi:hypothetical protein
MATGLPIVSCGACAVWGLVEHAGGVGSKAGGKDGYGNGLLTAAARIEDDSEVRLLVLRMIARCV